MSNDWILDVLADLHSFAEQNGLPALAAEIVRTKGRCRGRDRLSRGGEGERVG